MGFCGMTRRPFETLGQGMNMNKDSLSTALSRFVSVVKCLLEECYDADDRRIFEMYLDRVGVILTKVNQDQNFGNDVYSMERLFGNTWLKDGEAYSKAYATWDEFKKLLTQSIHGMTVNERLKTLGLIDEFDIAVGQKNESKLRAVLSKCFLTDANIQTIIDQQKKRV
jgi:hypothetical protein